MARRPCHLQPGRGECGQDEDRETRRTAPGVARQLVPVVSLPLALNYALLLRTCETPIRTEVFIRSLTGINYVLPPAFVFPCDEGLSLVLPEAAALRGR